LSDFLSYSKSVYFYAHNISVRLPKVKRELGRIRSRCEVNIKQGMEEQIALNWHRVGFSKPSVNTLIIYIKECYFQII
jgi:hypothetical protein